MSMKLAGMLALALGLSATGLAAQTPPDEKEFVRQHLQNIVRVDPVRLTDPAVASVFAVPLYRVMVEIGDPDGAARTSVMVGRQGDTLVTVTQPSEEQDRPDILKLLRPQFKLTGAAAAETVQNALDLVYPIIGSRDDERAKAFRRKGNEWIFVRGKYFEASMGFVLTTDASGTITGVRYVLKLPS
jgi:hypothetical protein